MPPPAAPEPREDGETDDRQAAIDAATAAVRAELEAKAEKTRQFFQQQVRDQTAKVRANAEAQIAAVRTQAAADLAAAANKPAPAPELDQAAIDKLKAEAVEQYKRDEAETRSKAVAARLAKAKAEAPPPAPVASTSTAKPAAAPAAAKPAAPPKVKRAVPPANAPTPTAGMSIKGAAADAGAGGGANKPPVRSVFAGAITQVTGEKRARPDDDAAGATAADAAADGTSPNLQQPPGKRSKGPGGGGGGRGGKGGGGGPAPAAE